MNFDEAFEHVKSGNATPEEKDYIEKELSNLKKIRDILDNPATENIVTRADVETVMNARKTLNKKTIIKVIIIVLACLIVIACIVCGIIFIPSCTSASRNQAIDEVQAIELAKDKLREMDEDIDVDRLIIKDIDRELRIPSGLNDAVYVYQIKFKDFGVKYTLEVSTKSGYAVVTDIDYYD